MKLQIRMMLLFALLFGLVFMVTSSALADIPPDDPSKPYVRPDPNSWRIETEEPDDEETEEIVSDTEMTTPKPKSKRCGAFGFAEITIFLIVVMSFHQLRRISPKSSKDDP